MTLRVVTVITLLSLLMSTNPSQTPKFDVLIKNGRIVDGSGRPGYNADIAIKGQRIVEIGSLKNATATRTIELMDWLSRRDSSTCSASQRHIC